MSEWIDVKSKLPQEWEHVAVVLYGKSTAGFLSHDMKPRWYVLSEEGYQTDNITHWMPLPAPPQQGDPMNALLFHATQKLAYVLSQGRPGGDADYYWFAAQAMIHKSISFVAYQIYAEWPDTYGPNVPRPDADTIWGMAEQAYLEPGVGG